MKMNLKNLSIVVTTVLSGIVLFLHGYLGYFSRYLADDFCSAAQARHIGILRAAWYWYLTWTGRYSASILDGMIGKLGPRVVPAVVPFTILIWLAALTILFLILFYRLKNSFLVSLALSVTTLFALFLLTPDLRGALYWGQGMRAVVPPLLLGTIQVILLNRIRTSEWTRLQLILWGILSFFWALGNGGFSETYAAFQVAALLFALFVVLFVEKFKLSNTTVFLVSGLLGAISALLIVILAPGNGERQTFYPEPPGLAGILTISLNGFLVYAAQFVNSPEKVLAIFAQFSLAAIVGSQLEREADPRLLIVIPSLTIGFAFSCFPPAAYGLSDAPPDRTLILPTYFFLLGLLALGFVCGNLLRKKQGFVTSTVLPLVMIATIIIAASINSINLYRSRSEFIQYAAYWDDMNAGILKAKQAGASRAFIPVIQNWAFLNTPNDNPRFWVNICMSSYYGLQILAAPDPDGTSP